MFYLKKIYYRNQNYIAYNTQGLKRAKSLIWFPNYGAVMLPLTSLGILPMAFSGKESGLISIH